MDKMSRYDRHSVDMPLRTLLADETVASTHYRLRLDACVQRDEREQLAADGLRQQVHACVHDLYWPARPHAHCHAALNASTHTVSR